MGRLTLNSRKSNSRYTRHCRFDFESLLFGGLFRVCWKCLECRVSGVIWGVFRVFLGSPGCSGMRLGYGAATPSSPGAQAEMHRRIGLFLLSHSVFIHLCLIPVHGTIRTDSYAGCSLPHRWGPAAVAAAYASWLLPSAWGIAPGSVNPTPQAYCRKVRLKAGEIVYTAPFGRKTA